MTSNVSHGEAIAWLLSVGFTQITRARPIPSILSRLSLGLRSTSHSEVLEAALLALSPRSDLAIESYRTIYDAGHNVTLIVATTAEIQQTWNSLN